MGRSGLPVVRGGRAAVRGAEVGRATYDLTVEDDLKDLIARAKAGDRAAFDELVKATYQRVHALALRLTGNEHDADDVVQDTYVRAFNGLRKFREDARFSTWLHRIVVNASLMKLRRRKRKPEESIDELLPKFKEDGHHLDPPGPWKSTSGAERNEVRQAVRAAIDQLPETHRTVLLLRDIEGLDTEETAKVLEVTPNAVKIRLHRARQALRALIDPTLAAD